MNIPLDVPQDMKSIYESNFKKATKSEHERLMLFAGDQKIEHMNDDFAGEGPMGSIPGENNDPEHLFKIAKSANIGIFATQFGMITRYGMDYKRIDYLVKMNSKTNLLKEAQADPISPQLTAIEDVLALKQNNPDLSIVGVGFTVYLGSEYEHVMLAEAAQLITDAHQNGMITVIWMYPRGKAVTNQKDAHLIAGATGVAVCIGADFVKVNCPKGDKPMEELLKEATQSAGRTNVICSGGSSKDEAGFLEDLHKQIHIGGCRGNATGRNIHQKSLDDAIKFANAIYAITVENKTVEEAIEIYKK